jgi:hypothetical protein
MQMADEYPSTFEEAEEEAGILWWTYWNYTGQDREVLIRWLKERPQDAEFMAEDIIRHLKNPNKRYLTGKSDAFEEMDFEEIYRWFETGSLFYEDFDEAELQKSKSEWNKLSYKQKIFKIHEIYNQFSESKLAKSYQSKKK